MKGGTKSCGIHTCSTSSPLCIILPVLLLGLQVPLHSRVSAQDGQVRCDVLPAKLHGNTSLTCHFPEDVSQTKRDFSVYRYTDKNNPYEVLDCWWMSGKVECRNAQGYEYNKTISNRLSLAILQVSSSQVASYTCHLAGYGPDSINTCVLKLELDGMSECEILSVKLKSQTALTCYFPEDLSKTRVDFSVSHHSTLGVLARVLSCTWTGEGPTCTTALGYLFDNKVTSHLTLQIPNALEVHEGTYSCQTEGASSSKTCSFALKQDNGYIAKPKPACNISSVKENEPAALTCIFSYDISVTKDNFEVVRLGDKGPNVASCIWTNGKLVCFTASGFNINKTVTDRVIIRLPQATPDHTGQYACRLLGSDEGGFTPCDFNVTAAEQNPVLPRDPHDDSSATVAAAVVVPLLVVIALIAVIVFVLWRKGKITYKQPSFLQRFLKKQEEEGSPEREQMMPIKDVDKIAKNFLADLSNSFRKTYPEYDTKAYVVPSLYINTNTYEVKTFAGEEVYVTKPPDQQTVKHDRAMSRVLTSLHLLAKHGKEVMFVISHFDYDKYLANPRKEFTDHKLPRPGQLRKHDKRYGDFDILIIHQHHGLMVGVVKTCSGESTQEEKETTKMVVEELKQGCTELDEAEKMLQHLMSDVMSNQSQQMQIQKLLILPNLSEERLATVLNQNQNIEQICKECLRFPETSNASKECLCGDHMRGLKRTQKIRDWFNSRFSESRDKAFASEDEYAAIVARFCGSATIWSSNVFDYKSGLLPKTLEDWVWMTGELFNKPRLQPQQWETLNTVSPLVFLSGPPASGKTRMLVLTAKRWMTEGHKVHVISTGRKSWAANYMIYLELLTTSKEKGISGSCELIAFETEDTKEMIKKLSKLAKKNPVYIIADEAYNSKRSSFRDFVGGLTKNVPGLHLWAASCLPDIAPQCCEVHVLTNSFTCPPSILLREDVAKLASDNGVATWRPESRTTAPTDGPPVMVVNHDGKGHNGDHPHDCKTCANEVIAFLQTLCVIKPVGANQKVEGQPRLCSKDILILCENEGETALCGALMKSGVSVKIIDEMNRVQVLKFNNNEVWEAKGENMFGIKRKVVVYVEGNPKDNHKMSVNLTRLRGLTSSISHLIWLKRR